MLNAPELLGSHHDTNSFDCGSEILNDWLSKRALKNQMNGGSRTYVLCDGHHVKGYYALTTGAIGPDLAVGRFRRNMPNPIPVVLLARLAVDTSLQGQGIGRALLRDAALRVLQAAELVGIRGMIVHALDGEAKAFYERLGFDVSPIEPMTFMITVADLSESLISAKT
jgi:GNAT superfamily N-acetyltransferase